MPNKPIQNLTGLSFGRLTVLEYAGRLNHETRWKCQCSCGVILITRRQSLKSGKTKSCGCLSIEMSRERATKHGDHGCKEYRAWLAMKQRCAVYFHHYKNYAGRGISVCDKWAKSYTTFLEDVGRCPLPGLTLDRIDNNGNYEPGNVRWATYQQQRNNQRK